MGLFDWLADAFGGGGSSRPRSGGRGGTSKGKTNKTKAKTTDKTKDERDFAAARNAAFSTPAPKKSSGIFDRGRAAAFDAPDYDLYERSGGLFSPRREDDIQSLLAQFASMLPGADSIPSYTAPYDEAMTRAKQTAESARPNIRSIYDNLTGSLQAGQQDLAGALANQRTQLAQRLAQQQGTVNQAGQAEMQKLQAQGVNTGSVLGNVAAEQGVRQQQMQAGSDLALNTSDRLAQIAQQGGESRIADVGGAKANAEASLDLNLQQLLSQLGLGKAKAQQEQTMDQNKLMQDRAQQLFGFEQNLRADEAKRNESLLKAAADNAKARRELIEKTEKDASTAGDNFRSTYPDLARSNPAAAQVFEAFLEEAGDDGPMSMAKALRLVDQYKDDLRGGDFSIDDQKVDGVVDPTMLEQWIRQFYDDQKVVR